jgi:hypothetical protein
MGFNHQSVLERKNWLINQLLSNDIYKMPDGRQFYEVSMHDLEKQYLLRIEDRQAN